MTWKVIAKQAAPTREQDMAMPVRLYLTDKGGRFTFYTKWLELHGLQKSPRVTLLMDEKQKLVAFQFLDNDLTNGYTVQHTQKSNSVRVQCASRSACLHAVKWGYPLKTCLPVVPDANDPTIWVVQKKAA